MKKRTKAIFLITFLLIFALGTGAILGAVTWIIQDTPDITDYKGSSEATLIYDADGELLTKLFKENRVYVPLERMPEDLKNAIVAIEDTKFYVHHGIDFWGIGRAMINNIMKGDLLDQGASTITQQLARNAFLTLDKNYLRKIQEAYLAIQFERLYTKSEILEMYLNEIFLGHSAYGVETASLQYFGKSVEDLTLAESALIAGLPQSPNNYTPLRYPERAIRRRNVVLDRMYELGYITEAERDQAKNAELNLDTVEESEDNSAHYFTLYVRDQLINRFGASMVYSGGLKVHTTLNPEMQDLAEETINNKIENGFIPSFQSSQSENLQPQLSLVSLDVNSGAIRAMIGGRGTDQFNRAYQAVRQPGSAFKPFVYSTALIEGDYTTGTVINDLPMLASETGKGDKLSIWPRNYGDRYRGLINLNTALTNSVNVAAVKLIQDVGVKSVIDFTERLGISTFTKNDGLNDHYSLALGGLNRGVTPIEMASAYSVFANKGIYTEPHAITEVYDKHDNLIYEAQPESKMVMSEDNSYLITSMLKSVVDNGTGRRAQMNRDVGGKTGTTNDYTDAWFVGFTSQIATSVWIGEDTNRSMEYDVKTVGSGEAAQIWGDYMREAVKDMPVINFQKPDNIIEVDVDPYTGLLSNQYSPRIDVLPYINGTEPTERESLHGPVKTVRVDRQSGLLATENCPADQVEERHYISDSGIRIGPTQKTFREVNSSKSSEDLVRGTYTIEAGEPVQQIDHEYGIPKVQRNGNPRYENKPNRICNLHPASQPLTEDADTSTESDSDDSSEESEDSIRSLFDIFGND
ncbi:penicillin-binding protein 1A [Halanaerobium saccharolyticum]|uniref:Penicillin-binding protein 1A n=1 Tax=Halanaerobium saccharolyticum TaxID=43595 RepID=A0A4R7YVR9_9FIRM|nr:PBP1A family penicillin-binding protein [Halanaerobium saccharolyticum]RAK06689.1 penicillin-binding protein 1A [Halanaerobium saccharolyticum]TDW01326.1 penicillin-binding protein 1A [Halanaerobium saccharolyticum]TDX52794.1 penicillin-binding protein 1A [Halanaerobium saccharolyticum]